MGTGSFREKLRVGVTKWDLAVGVAQGQRLMGLSEGEFPNHGAVVTASFNCQL